MSVTPVFRPPSTEEVREALMKLNILGPRLGGYELQQVHGQRKLYNPELKCTFAPPEGSEVFVGRLPRDLFEDELIVPFLRIGPIYEMRTMMNFSGTNRGFAFVCYFNRQAAQLAIETLNNFEIRSGQQIGVVLSVNNRRLHIKRLQMTPETRSSVAHWLSQVTEGIEHISWHPMFSSRRGQHGEPVHQMAVVEYTTHTAAAMARRALIPLKNQLFGPWVDIDWADPKLEAKRRRRHQIA